MQAFFGPWKSFERTFGVTFYQSLKRDAAYARLRGYPDSLAPSARQRQPAARGGRHAGRADQREPADAASLPAPARTRLAEAVRPGYPDAYSPLTQDAPKFPLDRSEALMLAAVRPLGEAYVSTVSGGLRAGWMDVYPRPRKRSGAYAWSAYGVHPYVLLNHNDDYESLTTLAHEWGHAMHGRLAQQAQPYVTADSATFVAEIASTLNEGAARRPPAEDGAQRRRPPVLPRLRARQPARDLLPPGDVHRVRARGPCAGRPRARR
jgi:oligoendopeptidase F